MTAPPLLDQDPSDRELAHNAHPPDWVNPTPAQRYDLLVIGGGTAGLVAAGTGSVLGARVALVEKGWMGGECLVSGCVPSKAMIRSGRAAVDVRRAPRFGIQVPCDALTDFGAAMSRMRRVRAGISPRDSARRFRDEFSTDVFLGTARFAGPDSVRVDEAVLRFDRCVLATGSRPAVPDVPGLADAGFFTNEDVFNLPERPPRLAVIGAGPLGCEMAQAFCRLGSHVTLIGKHERLMPKEDPEASDLIARVFRQEGIDLRLGARVDRVERAGTAKLICVEAFGGQTVIETDAILVGVGRTANVEGMGFESAGVRYSAKAVEVDDLLRTSNRRIFAAGDICLKEKFTHTADASARIAVQNALTPLRKRWSRSVVPWCTYTDPQIAHTGWSTAQATGRGLAVRTVRVPMADVDRAIIDGDDEGFLKIDVDSRSDRIIGATFVAGCAGEMITLLTAAIQAGRKLQHLSDVIFPYPTESEAIKRAADDYLRSRLSRTLLNTLRVWRALRP